MDLKLIALDAEDLGVLSAHLQDAVLTVGDMAYIPAERRFAIIANRFDWAAADERRPEGASNVRRRTGLRFERVLAAGHQGIDRSDKARVLALLALSYEQTADGSPEGLITLLFSGGGAVRLHVECIEAELKDLGAAWGAKSRPNHPDGDPSPRTRSE